MTECPSGGAHKRAEEICAKTTRIALEFHGELLEDISASIGISSFPRDGDSIEELISNADKALYMAKAQGRNRVCDAKNRHEDQQADVQPDFANAAVKAAAAK